MKNTLICDIDDVLWEMVPVWCECYNEDHQPDKKVSQSDLTSWDISNVLGRSRAYDFYSVLDSDEFWDKVVSCQDCCVLLDSRSLLKRLTEVYDVYIATATNYKNKHKLDMFFSIYDFLDTDRVLLIKDKWLIRCDIMIDDNADTLSKSADNGTRVIKINKPWNEWYECENYDHFTQAAEQLLKEV